MDQHGHIIDIIIAIIIMFLFPLLYFGQKQDALIWTIAEMETASLGDEIRSKGYLTKERYSQYLENMSDTGLIYDITLEHSRIMYEPEYRLRTPEEVINEQDSAYTRENIYHYRQAQTNIPEVPDPINNGNLNTETNESVMADAVDTPASDGHIHTAECYTGHKHLEGDGLTFTHTHAHEYECNPFLSSQEFLVICRFCRKTTFMAGYYFYWDALAGERKLASYINLNEFYNDTCPECGESPLSSGTSEIRTGYAYLCGYYKDLNGDGYYDLLENGVEYTYEKDYPQNQTEKMDYVQGCYKYHVHGFPRGYPDGCYWVLYDMYRGKGFEEFCFIPKYYKLILKNNEDESTVVEVTYRAEILEDGTGRFVLSDTYSPYYSLYGKLPGTLTLAQMYELTSSIGYYFVDFLDEYADISFVENWGDYIYFTTRFSDNMKICQETPGWLPICGHEEDDTMDCGHMITNIAPTHPVQTVYAGEPLITTVVITRADGSTTTQIGTTTFSTANPVQNKAAIISYTVTVDGLPITKTCNVTVTVILKNKVCTNGHTYNLNSDSSDPGCPYCRAWLASLVVAYPVSGSITIYRGTTLPDNGVTLFATYLDGRTEYVYTGYDDNLDRNYVGTQDVILSYNGLYTSLMVITRRNIILCPDCGRYYELYPDDTNPGCPYCQARTPIFTGNVMEYTDKCYVSDILKELYEGSGTYYFNDKDYFTICVVNKKAGWGRRFLGNIFKELDESNIMINYGGHVREEAK